jgi:hypothetical protein
VPPKQEICRTSVGPRITILFVVGGIELQSRGEPVVPLGKPLEPLPKAVRWLYVGQSPKLCGCIAMIRRLEQVSPRHPALHRNVRSASSYRHFTNARVAANSRSQGCVRREPVVRVVGTGAAQAMTGRSVCRMIGHYDDPETLAGRCPFNLALDGGPL